MYLVSKKKWTDWEGKLSGDKFRQACSHVRRRFKKKYKVVPENCPYCNQRMWKKRSRDKIQSNSVTVDHLVSRPKGGLYNDLDNMVYACHDCNDKKGEKLPLDFIIEVVSRVC